jgi:tRNA(fMet)-specific endonuclease VapC
MGVIFDTSVLIAAERGIFEVDAFVANREEEPFGLSVITVAELLHGVHRADSRARRIRRNAFVQKVIDLFPLLPFDTAAARVYAQIWADLQKKGKMIGAHDLMIGSTAISLGFKVVTLNRRDFEKIPGLKVEILPVHKRA